MIILNSQNLFLYLLPSSNNQNYYWQTNKHADHPCRKRTTRQTRTNMASLETQRIWLINKGYEQMCHWVLQMLSRYQSIQSPGSLLLSSQSGSLQGYFTVSYKTYQQVCTWCSLVTFRLLHVREIHAKLNALQMACAGTIWTTKECGMEL